MAAERLFWRKGLDIYLAIDFFLCIVSIHAYNNILYIFQSAALQTRSNSCPATVGMGKRQLSFSATEPKHTYCVKTIILISKRFNSNYWYLGFTQVYDVLISCIYTILYTAAVIIDEQLVQRWRITLISKQLFLIL